LRFSLKTLLTTISVAAVLCCIFFTLPAIAAFAVLGLVWLLAPPALIAGIVYGRGYGRAFSIGCVSTGGFMPIIWLYSSMMFAGVFTDLSSLDFDGETAIRIKLGAGATFALIGFSGLTSMVVRWFSLRMQVQEPKSTTPATTGSPADYSVLHRRITTLPVNLSEVKEHDPERTNMED